MKTTRPTPHPAPATYDELGLERIVFFSDAVIAIAITLLAIEIRLPPLEDGARLVPALWALWPSYLSFAISFLVIGTYWIAHHNMFEHIDRYTPTLIWLNLFFLLCVAFTPFPTAIVGEYGMLAGAQIFYAGSVVVTGVGAVSPCGPTMDRTWGALLEGRSGIAPLTQIDTTDLKTTFGGECRDFDPDPWWNKTDLRRHGRFTHLSVAATAMAAEMAGLETAHDGDRGGTFIGVALGGLPEILDSQATLDARGGGRGAAEPLSTVIAAGAPRSRTGLSTLAASVVVETG